MCIKASKTCFQLLFGWWSSGLSNTTINPMLTELLRVFFLFFRNLIYRQKKTLNVISRGHRNSKCQLYGVSKHLIIWAICSSQFEPSGANWNTHYVATILCEHHSQSSSVKSSEWSWCDKNGVWLSVWLGLSETCVSSVQPATYLTALFWNKISTSAVCVCECVCAQSLVTSVHYVSAKDISC